MIRHQAIAKGVGNGQYILLVSGQKIAVVFFRTKKLFAAVGPVVQVVGGFGG